MRFRLRVLGSAALGLAGLGAVARADAAPSPNRSKYKAVFVLESLATVAAHVIARALEESTQACTERLARCRKTFANVLNEKKAHLAIIGEDAAADFDTWRQATEQSWSARPVAGLDRPAVRAGSAGGDVLLNCIS